MTLQILPNEAATKVDSSARILLEHLRTNQAQLELEGAVVFCNFPLFREDERLLVAQLVLASPLHGVTLISTESEQNLEASQRLEGAFSQVFSRLVKYPKLRAGRAKLLMNIDAFRWSPDGDEVDDLRIGLPQIDSYLRDVRAEAPLAADAFDELLSVLDGSKALLRPKERATVGFSANSRIAAIARLEEEIRRFDRDQRVAYMSEVYGPQRIRGLAGSGKTVVLAFKAALTAVLHPDARIAVTFYTKSLYQHIKQLITRFYRMHEDRDPDWTRLQVLHAWGGATANGLYYSTARRFGHQPLNFAEASAISRQQPFGAACARLLADSNVRSSYDYVFVDEAQDFPPEFMRLALKLAEEEKLVIAYDVFQTIFDVEVQTAGSLFGTDKTGEPAVSFDEDIILHKCYRNPREILVCAHAIGFGVYGRKIVQMLESPDHWRDFGYETNSELVAGREVVISRSQEFSPSSISNSNNIDNLLHVQVFNSADEETSYIAEKIYSEITQEGVAPEDILVISADDRNNAIYFQRLKAKLALKNISTNNLQDDSYSIRDFQQDGSVTFSTIYKAKGNEAYSVYILGIDSLFYEPGPRNRNRAFTAMTRAKGWLCVTGIGQSAQDFVDEINIAKNNFPHLKFKYPSPEELVFMKRDLIEVDPDDVDSELSRLTDNMADADVERLLKRRLKELQQRKRARRK